MAARAGAADVKQWEETARQFDSTERYFEVKLIAMRVEISPWSVSRLEHSASGAAAARFAAAIGRVMHDALRRLGRRRIRIPPMSEEWLRRRDVEDGKHGEGW